MRYFLRKGTLFIRGIFRTACPATPDGVATASTLLIHSVPRGSRSALPETTELERAAEASGFLKDFAGFTTTNPINSLCIFQCDFITVFIAAGADPSVIIVSTQGLTDAALLQAAGTARHAVTDALAAAAPAGHTPPGSRVIIGGEGETVHDAADPESPAGSRIRAALLYGVPLSLQRAQKPSPERPAFFIFSRFKGEHWVEWVPEDCPYYPCHFEGQRCDFCYCPLYPCADESLGQWTASSNGGKVWNCARCTMIHEPPVADYLKEHPEATKDELIRVWKRTRK